MDSKRINKLLMILTLLTGFSLLPVHEVLAHAGVVLFVNGKVSAKSLKGKTRSIKRGSKVHTGDLIITGIKSQIQIRAGDGSMLSLQENSKLRIIKHKHTGTVDEQSSLVELVKGGMRAVTGLIGKNKPENFKIKVKQSTIGIRGTEFVIQLCENDCDLDPNENNIDPAENGVYVGVLSGAITVERKEQVVELDSSLNVVMGVSMGIDEKKRQYLFIGDKKDAKVETLPKPPAVILQALAPPPVKITPGTRKKPPTHTLTAYSGISSDAMTAHISATLPAKKALSAVEDFDMLAYPTAPDVHIKNRFIYPKLHGIDIKDGSFHDLSYGNQWGPPPP